MSQTLISDAVAEAYACAPEDELLLHALELWHPTFVDGANQPTPIRVVLDDRDWSLALEDDAPRNAGAAVTFKGLAFEMTLPGSEESGPTASRLALDGVSGELRSYLETARRDPNPIEVIYRVWAAQANINGAGVLISWVPDAEPGEIVSGLVLRDVQLKATRAEGVCSYDTAQGKAFPAAVYDRSQYPAL